MECWRNHPQDKEATLQFADACFEKGLKDKAIQLLGNIIEQTPENIEAFLKKAEFQIRMKKSPVDTYKAAISKGHITEEICLGMKEFEKNK